MNQMAKYTSISKIEKKSSNGILIKPIHEKPKPFPFSFILFKHLILPCGQYIYLHFYLFYSFLISFYLDIN
jgi:hypothetical protein